MHHKRVRLWIIVFSVLLGLSHSPVHAAEEPFPLYPVIDPNVTFWTAIYARYSTTQAVVHDSVHLDIVYEVINLKPADYPGARKINRRRMKKAGQKVESVLKRLATDPLAEDADCRRVAALFGPGADARTFSHARHRVRCQIGQRDRFQAGDASRLQIHGVFMQPLSLTGDMLLVFLVIAVMPGNSGGVEAKMLIT